MNMSALKGLGKLSLALLLAVSLNGVALWLEWRLSKAVLP